MDLFFVFLFIFITAFFNGSETAIISINRLILRNKLDKGIKSAKILDNLIRNLENLISIFLICVNISDVSIVIFFTKFLQKFTNNNNLIVICNTVILTPLVLTFGTLIPKVIFRKFSDRITYPLSYIYLIVYYIFYPIQFILIKLIKFFFAIIGIKKSKGVFSKEEFNTLLEITTNKGILKESERGIIENILNFKNIKANEVMIPLVRMTCVEENDPVEIALALMYTTKHNRLPVFRLRVDNMIGYVEIKDLISAKRKDKVKEYIKPAIYVPDIAQIDNILSEMLNKKTQMAFAVDEFGGISGIITNNDIISELLGEFANVHDSLIKKEDDYYIVNGLCGIDELNEELGLNIIKSDFDTVAGFITSKLQKIPKVGDTIYYGRYIFEVISATNVRINKIKIYPYKKQKK